jgi:HEAT repeat protein
VTKKRSIILTVLLVIICAGIWLYAVTAQERLYQGRPLSAWLNDMENWNYDTNSPTFTIFRTFGTNALPDLLVALQQRSTRLEELAVKLNRMQSVVNFPSQETWRKRMAAAWAINSMGTNALSALPVLTNLLFQTNAFDAGMALSGIGPEALPALFQAVTNSDRRIRTAAISSLSSETSNQDQIVPVLLKRLDGGDKMLCEIVINSLGYLHSLPEIVVPALITNYVGTDELLHNTIISSLTRFGTNAQSAIPLIKTAMEDRNETTRQFATNALRQIDPELQTQEK